MSPEYAQKVLEAVAAIVGILIVVVAVGVAAWLLKARKK